MSISVQINVAAQVVNVNGIRELLSRLLKSAGRQFRLVIFCYVALTSVTFYPEGSRSRVVDGLSDGPLSGSWWSPRTAGAKGSAGALTQECLRQARRGVRAIGLHTDSRMPIAQLLYLQLGFSRAPEFVYQPLPGVDITVMGWTQDLATAPAELDEAPLPDPIRRLPACCRACTLQRVDKADRHSLR